MSAAPTADPLALHFELKPGSNYKLRAFGKAHILETHTPESRAIYPELRSDAGFRQRRGGAIFGERGA